MPVFLSIVDFDDIRSIHSIMIVLVRFDSIRFDSIQSFFSGRNWSSGHERLPDISKGAWQVMFESHFRRWRQKRMGGGVLLASS